VKLYLIGARNGYFDRAQGPPGYLVPRRIVSDAWRIEFKDMPGMTLVGSRAQSH